MLFRRHRKRLKQKNVHNSSLKIIIRITEREVITVFTSYIPMVSLGVLKIRKRNTRATAILAILIMYNIINIVLNSESKFTYIIDSYFVFGSLIEYLKLLYRVTKFILICISKSEIFNIAFKLSFSIHITP